jgi:competence protein ComFA
MSKDPQKATQFPPLAKETKLSYQYSGKILLREELKLSETVFKELISQGYFTPISSIIRKNLTYECQRCHNRKRSLFAMIDCSRCGNLHVYCRKCIEMGRVLACEPLYIWNGEEVRWQQHENPCTWEGKLTTVQQTAADRIVKAIQMIEAEILIWGVCGSGKTEMLFQGITKALQLQKRICIATPRTDVVRELYPRFKDAFPTVHIQALYGGSKEDDGTAQLMIATTHQLLRYHKAFDVLIIDEVDAFPYHADPSLPFATKRSKKKIGTTVYLTATPRKEQKRQLLQKKLPHIFVPIRFHGCPLPVPQLKMCFSLKKDLQKNHPPSSFLSWLKKRNHQERQLLIFVPTIQLAEDMKKNLAYLLVNEGVIRAGNMLQAVHAEDIDREEKVNLFRRKKLTVLVTTTILERGVTFPSIDVVVLDAGHFVFDEAALVQIAGRAGRSSNDPTGEVIFFHDGKTEAMVQSIQSIIAMNKRGRLI